MSLFLDKLKELDPDRFIEDPQAELERLGLPVHKTLLGDVNQIKELSQEEKELVRKDLQDVVRLTDKDLDPDIRKEINKQLADRYRPILHTEDAAGLPPCW